MRLSVNYNFFNGEDCLYECIKNMRPLAEHISLTYQEYSNLNYKISDQAIKIIETLKLENLIDDFIIYQPDFSKTTYENEYEKRKLGFELAKRVKATHFLLSDVDEFYVPDEFIQAKKIIEEKNITFSACHTYFYIQKPIYRSQVYDVTNVCFICKLDESTIFKYNQSFPVKNVDPTRRIVNTEGNFYFFTDEIVMHHMNFVRYNFDSKLKNSSSNYNKELRRYLEEIKKALIGWKFGKKFDFPNKGSFEIIEVDNIFKIKAEYKKENTFSSWRKYYQKIVRYFSDGK